MVAMEIWSLVVVLVLLLARESTLWTVPAEARLAARGS